MLFHVNFIISNRLTRLKDAR